MKDCISLEEREVIPKGVQQTAVAEEKVQSFFFDDDYERLQLLNKINIQLNNSNPTLFYPGCGADIFFPLIYVEKLFPKLKKANFFFVDTQECLNLLLTQLDDVNVSFSQDKNIITFYWKHLLVTLEFIITDVFTMQLPSFDIYFERAFRIMKSEHPEYERWIFDALNPNGIIISDSGFQHLKLDQITAPKELSGYGEMVVAVKPGS